MIPAFLVRVVVPGVLFVAALVFGGLLVREATPEPRPIPEPPRTMAGLVPSPAAPAQVSAPADPTQFRGWTLVRQGNGRPGNMPCAVCHGQDGAGRPESGIPRLAGLDATYLAKQLRDYQAGTRVHFSMSPVAHALAPEDIDAAAAYFSALPAPPLTPTTVESNTIAVGAWIAQRGIPERGIAPCNSCHGVDGIGAPPVFPRLQGQSAAYLASQMEQLRNGTRTNDPTTMMVTIAKQLTPEEVDAIAAYYQSLGAQVPRPTATVARAP